MYSILFYNGMWGADAFKDIVFPPGFHITSDTAMLGKADAVVFHMPSLVIEKPIDKPDNQLWVFWSMESGKHYPRLMRPEVQAMFDLFLTYKLNSDVPVPYIEYELGQCLRQPPVEKTGDICAFISSSFNQSHRLQWLKELMTELPVDSYGKVFNNKVIENDNGLSTKMDIISKYKFAIAFENAIDEDYVTEKFYDPLIAGAVPVYLGAPNIDRFAPGDHCFIDAAGFKSPKELAACLRTLMANDHLYQEYLAWKQKPYRETFQSLLDSKQIHPFVKLCYKVEEILSGE